MKKYYILIVSILNWNFGFSQDVPTPGALQNKKIAIIGATIHIGNGNVIENGCVQFDKGIITSVEPFNKNLDTQNITVVQAFGKHVYPGLVALNTELGLIEIEAVRSTRDLNEVGVFNPNIRSIIAYSADSRIIPTVRSNGILTAQVVPGGGRISGTSSVVQLDAWNWEDAMIRESGVHIQWPNKYSYTGWWAEPGVYTENKEYLHQVSDLKDFLLQSKYYSKVENPLVKNLRYEAMRKIWNGQDKLYIAADNAKEILDVLILKDLLQCNIVLVGAQESYKVIDEIKSRNVAIILDKIHSLPANTHSNLYQPLLLPKLLESAGILWSLSIRGSWQVRNLPFQAGSSVAGGLSKEIALKSICLNAAKILGLESQLGSLEIGKKANIIISKGDLLDMSSSVVEKAFIDGREISLKNKQVDLFDKYAKKYNIN